MLVGFSGRQRRPKKYLQLCPFHLKPAEANLRLAVFVSHYVIKSVETLIHEVVRRNESEHLAL